MDELEPDLRTRLNAETARMPWPELQVHFARGVVIRVARELDLVEVACTLANDDQAAVESWASAGQVVRATDDDARGWHEAGALLWTVVVAPWVLVQDSPGSPPVAGDAAVHESERS